MRDGKGPRHEHSPAVSSLRSTVALGSAESLLTGETALATEALLSTVATLLTTVAASKAALGSAVALLCAVASLTAKATSATETAALLTWRVREESCVSGSERRAQPNLDTRIAVGVLAMLRRTIPTAIWVLHRRRTVATSVPSSAHTGTHAASERAETNVISGGAPRRVTVLHAPSRTRVGHVDTNATSVELLLIETSNGSISLLLRTVGDKAKTARATSLAILHDNLSTYARSVSIGRNEPRKRLLT